MEYNLQFYSFLSDDDEAIVMLVQTIQENYVGMLLKSPKDSPFGITSRDDKLFCLFLPDSPRSKILGRDRP